MSTSLEKILSEVQTEFGMGGLSDGVYGEYAREVATRFAAAYDAALTSERERFNRILGEHAEQNKRLETAMLNIYETDRTEEYRYGEPDRNGRTPEAGQRWANPREIVRDTLGRKRVEDHMRSIKRR